MNSHRTKTPKVSKILVYSDVRYEAIGFYLKVGFKEFGKFSVAVGLEMSI